MSFSTEVVSNGTLKGDFAALETSNTDKVGTLNGRCAHLGCGKKLSFTQQTIKCICEKSFCDKHRQLERHSCSDLTTYIEQKRLELKEQLEGQGKMSKSKSLPSFKPGSNEAY